MREPEWLGRILRPLKQWFRLHVDPLLPGGWRTAALVNTVLIAIVSVLLTILSALVLIKAGGFNKPLVFFTGACGITGASALNATLHIIINILSTAILASSNMFMQVLNAPSREEVDQSHARGSWLEIGVLSGRNILRLSPFKTIAWLGFLISSVPIHLLFNSAIFQASYRFSQYNLAIVSEQFLRGGNYFTPGASLLNSGGLVIYDARVIYDPNNASSNWSPDLWAGYGDFVDLTEYRDNKSVINEKIAAAAQNGSTWTRISKEACKQEYLTCSGLSTHSDVIIVVSGTEGWPRSHVWSLNMEQSSFWDAYVPDDISEPEHNSLWFYGKCAMSAYSGNGQTICGNSCRWALGGSNATKEWVVPFFPINSTSSCFELRPGDQGYYNDTSNHKPINSTKDCFVVRSKGDNRYHYADWNNSSIYNPKQNDLNIDYCLARPVQESCKVALSTTLLVCVTGCAILKAILCVWVYCRLRNQNPLTTPGDAINSFISKPDTYTMGMSLISQGEIRMSFLCGAPQPGPRKYRQRERKLGTAVPWSEWLFLLAIMVFALVGAVALMFIIGIGAGGIRGGFGTNSSNPLTNSGTSLLNAVLIANSPQLALSTVYVIYNNTFTRLVVGRAWALRSTQHSYLRVTDAKGLQRSTYRLQLPYRYSIPLIIASALLHWLMSNTIYVFISQGDYFQNLGGSATDSEYSDSNLPPGSTVSVGYSIITLAILALCLLVGYLLPSIWSQKPLVGFGNSVGCNSFAMSASCHVSTLSRPDSESDIPRKIEGQVDLDMPEAFNDSETELALLSPAENDSGNHQEDERLRKIAQSRLRWGVVKMPQGWSSQYSGSYDQVGHISFGTTNDEVEEPVHDRWYA